MDNPQSFQPIEAFLADAERRLRRHVPDSHLQTILTEARSHLEQRAADFVAEGRSASDAARASVASFGTAGAWARGIIDAQYADAGTAAASRIVLIGALAAIIAYLLLTCGDLFPSAKSSSITDLPGVSICAVSLLIAGLATFAAASFRARQPRLFPLVVLVLVTSASLFAAYGSMFVTVEDFGQPYQRDEIPSIIQAYAQGAEEPNRDYPLLCLGQATFYKAATHPGVAIPTVLRSSGGYIVPLPPSEQPAGPLLWQSAFKKPIVVDPSNRARSLWLARHRNLLESATPYKTVATIPKATIAWARDGHQYLIQDAVMLQSIKREIKNFRDALARAPRFDQDAGWYGARIAWNDFGVLIGLQYFSALLGRWAFRMRTRRAVVAA